MRLPRREFKDSDQCTPRSAGWVAEWSNAPDLKSGKGASPSWVRIPPHPPSLFAMSITYSITNFLSAIPSTMIQLVRSNVPTCRCSSPPTHKRQLSTYSVEKLPDGAFSIVSGGGQTINPATRVAYTRFWKVGFLIHLPTRQRNRVFQQNRSQSGRTCRVKRIK